ncbi:MAG: DnaJ domain-containing protein [Parcubacteria group bacterium]|nr:DnaJ domain-containing protein [Parcubacteria group bacterium]
MPKDYYQVLGVSKGATKENIKKAYHQLARKFHPDNKETGDESKFKEISEAYYTLSDDKRRAEYDAYGSVFSGAQGGGANRGGFPFGSGGFGSAGFDLGDIFEDFFGGVAGSGNWRGGFRSGTPRGRDISIDIDVSFAEGAYGVERTVLLAKTTKCTVCSGTGGEPGTGTKTCVPCNGQGRFHETRSTVLGTITSVRECDECKGEGKVPNETCHECRGMGVLRRQEEITIRIPAGIEDGSVIREPGTGEAVLKGTPGDLYVRVHVARHPYFRRDGNDLVMNLNIKLTDALLGATYPVHALDGSVLKVKIPAGVGLNEKLRVKGKGVPLEGGRKGDLLVKLNVNLPSNLSERTKELIEKLRKEGI